MYEPGNYAGPVVRVGTAESKEKKAPYIYVDIEIKYRQCDDESWARCEEATRTIFFYVSDAAMPNSAPRLQRIGFNGDFVNPEISPPAEWKGNIKATCRHEDYKGRPQERWDVSGFGGTMEHKPLDANAIRVLNQKYRNEVKPTNLPARPADPQPSSAGGTAIATEFDPHVDDGVPF